MTGGLKEECVCDDNAFPPGTAADYVLFPAHLSAWVNERKMDENPGDGGCVLHSICKNVEFLGARVGQQPADSMHHQTP